MTQSTSRTVKKVSWLQVSFLWLFWVMLSESIGLGNLLLGFILSWLISWLMTGFQMGTLYLKSPWRAGRYLARLVVDVVHSNLQVAVNIVSPMKKLNPAIVIYPLSVERPTLKTMLASTITLTPGTLSVELSADGTALAIHVIHLDSEDQLITSIKQRYENELKEIFDVK